MDTILQDILPVLPARLHAPLRHLEHLRPEDIRLRAGQPPGVYAAGHETPLAAAPVTWQELEQVLMAATDHSYYAAAEQLADGFVTLPGGHRVGVCGTLAVRGGSAVSVRNISSVCIRLARDVPCAVPELTRSTLLLGALGSGKTTLLRACIRALSRRGQRVCVADERGEIAACVSGQPQMDIGPCTDVLTGGKKAQSMMILLRAMRPDWIAVDEITAPEDLAAIRQCSYCGVRLLATAHAESPEELARRPLYRELLALGVFDVRVWLDGQKNWREETAGC